VLNNTGHIPKDCNHVYGFQYPNWCGSLNRHRTAPDACAVQNVEMVVLDRRACEAVCVSSAGVTVAIGRSTTHTEARGGTHRQLSDHLGEYSGTTLIVTLPQQKTEISAALWIEPPVLSLISEYIYSSFLNIPFGKWDTKWWSIENTAKVSCDLL
jgi:hypothetical protein